MFQKGNRWPDFVWLFHDLSIEDLILSTEKCGNDTMQTAVEGVFLMRYRLQPNPNTFLVSGPTYSEYLMELHSSGVARTSPLLGHSMGTLCLYKLPRKVQKLIGGCRGILPPKI